MSIAEGQELDERLWLRMVTAEERAQTQSKLIDTGMRSSLL